MADATVDYDAPDLAARIEQLSQDQLDHLPFGVVLLNAEGVIQFYSETEARQSGYGSRPIGLNFFEISRCGGKNDFHAQIVRAQEEGRVDIEFTLARELGFRTAVTTRPGMIFPENAAHMMALPRISLNGNYQNTRFLSVLTSGAATAMWNGFRRVDAA